MSRFLSLIEGRYYCDSQYCFFSNDLKNQDNQRVLYTLLSKNPSVILDGKLFLPLRLYDQLWGYVQFSTKNKYKLESKQVHEIEDLLDLVINSVLIKITDLEDLCRLENEIHLSECPSNVIPLFSFRKTKTNTPVCLEGLFKQTTRPRRAFSTPCLIEAQSYDDIYKMAIELHCLSGRQMFVHFEDLFLEASLTARDLNEITDTTIFIPDVTTLKYEEQIIIVDWLSGLRTKESPQIIAGSVVPYEELISTDKEVQRVLLRRLSVVNLRMEKSFEYYLRKGVVNFFYNSITNKNLKDPLF